MKQSYIQVNTTGKGNYKAGKDTSNIIQSHDIGHTVPSGKTYLATDKDNNKVARPENQESVITHDFFGAFNY